MIPDGSQQKDAFSIIFPIIRQMRYIDCIYQRPRVTKPSDTLACYSIILYTSGIRTFKNFLINFLKRAKLFPSTVLKEEVPTLSFLNNVFHSNNVFLTMFSIPQINK